ncbi:MAG TPA: DUF2306 domain-containing protein [Sphingomicrobium sp.]|nr:DUF2306 domain-containing protein [Sphingomicrobium sp.]
MATSIRRSAPAADVVKYLFFLAVALSIPLVLWADEGFLLHPADPHWKHIAPVKWLLLIHGLGGVTALSAGTLQMSSRIRRLRPALHRALGKIYLGAVSIAAPVAIYMGTSSLEPVTIRFEQWFQGGGWLLSAWIAYTCIRNGQMPLHKAWMMRSYAFTLIFLVSRVPDAFLPSYSDQFLGDLLWSMVIVAALAPELIITSQTLWRIRRAKARHATGSPAMVPAE